MKNGEKSKSSFPRHFVKENFSRIEPSESKRPDDSENVVVFGRGSLLTGVIAAESQQRAAKMGVCLQKNDIRDVGSTTDFADFSDFPVFLLFLVLLVLLVLLVFLAGCQNFVNALGQNCIHDLRPCHISISIRIGISISSYAYIFI